MPLLLLEQIDDDNALINNMLENMAVLNTFDSLGERLAEYLISASPASVNFICSVYLSSPLLSRQPSSGARQCVRTTGMAESGFYAGTALLPRSSSCDLESVEERPE